MNFFNFVKMTTRSLGHSVTRSLGHSVTRSLGHSVFDRAFALSLSIGLLAATAGHAAAAAAENPAAPAIGSFGLPGNLATIAGSEITWQRPFGTSLTALSPVFSLSPGATCDHLSGSTCDLSAPVPWVVTSADGLSSRTYTVTAQLDTTWRWINVNIDTQTRTGLVGPAGGAAATWNQSIGTAGLTKTALLDSLGQATTVGFTCDADCIDPWCSPSLSLLGAAAFNFTPNSPAHLVPRMALS